MRLSFIEPMMPTLVDDAPAGDDWIHEVKYDGYRTQIIVGKGKAQIFTRRGLNWTAKYVPIARAAEQLPATSAILDGEIIVPNAAGASDFAALKAAIEGRPARLVFVAFDLLHFDGLDLRRRPLLSRKEILWRLLEPAEGIIQYSQHVDGHGPEFFNAADQMGLEGIVSKRAKSHYRSGPTKSWLKIKCFEENDYEIAGVLREPGSAPLALMVTRDQERRYVGSAIVSLKQDMRERLWQRVQDKAGKAPKGVKKPAAQWTQPGLVGRVRHLRGEEKLRHATLRDLKEEG
jgi:DNA ligase D-like protein (predicted ligase)